MAPGTQTNNRVMVMIFQWQIFVNGENRGTVKSITKQGAIDFWFNHFGSANRYSGIGPDQIEAVRLG